MSKRPASIVFVTDAWFLLSFAITGTRITIKVEATLTLDDTILRAIELDRQIKGDDLKPVFLALEADLAKVSGQIDVSTLLPGGANAELGMAAKKIDGPRFYAIFTARIRANLCARDGQFSSLIQSGVQTSVGAVVTALATALSFPPVALPLLVAIAVLISHSGLEAFCEATKEDG